MGKAVKSGGSGKGDARNSPGAPAKRKRGRPKRYDMTPQTQALASLSVAKDRVRFAGLIPERILVALDITPQRVEQRLLRAIQTLQVLDDKEARFRRGMGASWPAFRQEAADEPAAHAAEVRAAMMSKLNRFVPTRADRDDWDTAMAWIAGSKLAESFRLLRYRAAGFSYEQIATILGRPRSSVHKQVGDIFKGAFDAALMQALGRGARETRLYGARRHDGSDAPGLVPNIALETARGRASAHAELLALAHLFERRVVDGRGPRC